MASSSAHTARCEDLLQLFRPVDDGAQLAAVRTAPKHDETAVDRAATLPFVDARKLAFVAHSFGARSALLAALQEPRTAALVSLDGGIGAARARRLRSSTRRATPGPVSRLRIDDGGPSGRTPIVFVHGNGASLTHWSEALVHVRASRREWRSTCAATASHNRYASRDTGSTKLRRTSARWRMRSAWAASFSWATATAAPWSAAYADALARYVTRFKSADYARMSRAALQASPQGAKSETSERVLGRARGRVARGVHRLLRGATKPS